MRTLLLSILLWSAHGTALTDAGPSPNATFVVQRRCGPLTLPSTLPTVDQLIDSAGLTSALRDVQGGEFLLSVVFMGRGRPTLLPLDSWVGAPDSLLPLVVASVRATADVDAPSVRLRIRLTTPPRVKVERSELCIPVALDAGGINRVTVTTAGPPPARLKAPVVRMRIGSDGSVLAAEVARSSGLPELDQEILRTAPQLRFRPALLDGRPIEVWLDRGRAEVVR